MSNQLKVGDQVIVLTGKNKGQVGEVLSFKQTQKRGIYAQVNGVNIRQRAVRANPERSVQGGFKSIHGIIHVSNLAIYNPEAGKKDKIAYQQEDGKKQRVYQSTQKPISAKS